MTTMSESRMLRVWLGMFALAALALVLVTGWLRFLVPSRHGARVRDVMSWVPPPQQGR
jgi:hypothetical protein